MSERLNKDLSICPCVNTGWQPRQATPGGGSTDRFKSFARSKSLGTICKEWILCYTLHLGGNGDYFQLIKFTTNDPAQEKSCSQGKALHQHRLTTCPFFHSGKTEGFNPNSKTSQNLVSIVIAQTKIKRLGQPVHPFIPPLFFCLDSEELLLGLCGLWWDSVPHFPGTKWQHRAQPRAIPLCMFSKLWAKGEDFLFSSECRSHITVLKMQCKWDFKTNFNLFPLLTFNQKKVFYCYQKWQKCPFASYAQDRKLSLIIKGSIRKNGFNMPRELSPKSR